MSNDLLVLPTKHLRATDTNSLLRLYDQAQAAQRTSPLRQVRERLAKALARLTAELRKRQVPVQPLSA